MEQPDREEVRATYGDCDHEGKEQKYGKWTKEEAHISMNGDERSFPPRVL